MGRIRFEATESLRTLLEEAKQDERHLKLYSEICRALEEGLVPYSLLRQLHLASVASCLRGSRITFRAPPKPESEVMLQARLLAEERLYRRMVRRKMENEPVAEEMKDVRRIIAGLLNGLFSVAGVGAATFVVSRKTLGWSLESCVLLTVIVCVIVIMAELCLLALYLA